MTVKKQTNGLPTKYLYMDSIPMHNFSNNEEWADPSDSTFMMKPPEGRAWVISQVSAQFSTNANFHCPMTVKYYIHGVPTPVKSTVYNGINSFFSRCPEWELRRVAGEGEFTSNIHRFEYRFDEEAILWGSVPPDYNPSVKPLLSHFTMGIDDNVPYKALDDTEVQMASVRYPGVVIYSLEGLWD